MHDAGLDLGLGENCADRLGEALQPVDNGNQDVSHAAVLQLVHDPQPELGALGLLDPQTEHLLGTVGPDPERDIDGLVADRALVAHLDADRVEEDQRIERLERPVLPFGDLVEHGIGHRADQVRRDLEAVDLRYCPGGYRQAASRSAQGEARWVSGWRRCRPRFSLTRGRIVDSKLRWTVPPSTSSRKLT